MSFSLVFYTGDVKPHYVPDGCRLATLVDLNKRFPEVFESHSIRKKGEPIGTDRGGAMFINATQVSVPVAGSQLQIPVRDIEFYYAELLAAEPRFYAGDTFYKLHGKLHCIVLSAEQRRLVLYAWEQMLGTAIAAALAENIQFQRVAADLNNHPNIRIDLGLPFEHPQDN